MIRWTQYRIWSNGTYHFQQLYPYENGEEKLDILEIDQKKWDVSTMITEYGETYDKEGGYSAWFKNNN